MTRIIGLLLTSLFLFLILVLTAHSKNISELKVNISENTVKDCTLGIYVWGCYLFEPKQIYLSSDLDVRTFEYTFWHEIGHYFFDGEDLSKFENEETAADLFARTFMENPPCYIEYCSTPTQEQKDYFKSLLNKNL